MSQIFGVGGFHDAEELRTALDRMARVIRRSHQPRAVLWSEPGDGVGLGYIPEHAGAPRTGGSELQPGHAPQPCVVDGLFYRGALAASAAAETPAALLALYAERGVDALAELDGSFSFAAYDRAAKRLLLANDRFSTRTLYWTQSGERVIFASELKAVLAVPGIAMQIDEVALVQCAGFNRILNERTLVRGIARLPGGTAIEWQEGSRARVQRYWRIDGVVAQRETLTAERRDAVIDALRDSVRLRTSAAQPVGISLSGGLDSRAIAAVIGAEGIRATSVTTGFAGSADQRLAAQISRVARMDHHFFELRKEAIADYQQAVRSAVFVRDGMALVGGFPATLTQQFCEQFGIKTLLRGHGGENAKLAEAWPFQVTPDVRGMRGIGELRPHLRRVLATRPPDVDLDRLLQTAGGGTAAESALDAAIDGAVAAYEGLSPAEVMSVLYLVQNDGIEVPITRNGLRGLAEMALPFLDYRLLDLLVGTRIEDRCDVAIHIAIVRRFAPALLKIANSNTGAPMDASPLRLLVTDKANTLLKRLRVPGFRHYHYMEEWLQGFLAEQVRSIVLDERTLARGVFARDYVLEIMERARGDSRLSRLVNFIMNFELWCRLFIDGEGMQQTAGTS